MSPSDQELVKIHERLDNISVQFAEHVAREELTIKTILQAMEGVTAKVEEMHSIHTQAKGGVKLIIITAAVIPVVYGTWDWIKSHVTF